MMPEDHWSWPISNPTVGSSNRPVTDLRALARVTENRIVQRTNQQTTEYWSGHEWICMGTHATLGKKIRQQDPPDRTRWRQRREKNRKIPENGNLSVKIDSDDEISIRWARARVMLPILEYVNRYALPEAERARSKNRPSWNHEPDQDGPDVLASK